MPYGLTQVQLDTIVHHLGDYPEVDQAVLFGSRAMNAYHKASDIDIALMGNRVQLLTVAKIKSQLEEETNIPYFFDICAFSILTHQNLIEHIVECGIKIFDQGESQTPPPVSLLPNPRGGVQ